MNPRRTLATAARILRQLRHDHRSVALIFLMPILLMGLLTWMLSDAPSAFDNWGPWIVGVFPLIIMFVVTSVATLRERTSGTLERVLLTPVSKAEFLSGYALAFGFLGVLQAVLVSVVSFTLYGMSTHGAPALITAVAVADALLGTALGLLASSVARTEFQAVQMMPMALFPQLLLCGLIVPRDQMPDVLYAISWAFPVSYSVDAVNDVIAGGRTAEFTINLAILLAFVAGALVLGGATLRRARR